MAGALRKAWRYLGLDDEDDRELRYDDDYEETEVVAERPRERREVDREDAPRVERRESAVTERRAPVRVERVERVEDVEEDEAPRRGAHVALAPVEERPSAEITPFPRRTPVSEVVKDVETSGVHRISTIHPRTYSEAKKIGETFREGTPVIMNLSDLDDADAKRLVDFAAGLVFGLSGTIERVTNKVFLLSPVNLEVTNTESEHGRGRRGLFGPA